MQESFTYALVDLKGTNQFGEAIRRFRKQRGLTQQQLADKVGCSIMFISQLERGKKTAELGKALAVLDALDVELSFSTRQGR